MLLLNYEVLRQHFEFKYYELSLNTCESISPIVAVTGKTMFPTPQLSGLLMMSWCAVSLADERTIVRQGENA